MLTFLRFGRLHTLVGTSLSLIALYAMASRHTGESRPFELAVALFACLTANYYITGLNQLTDVEIDRINKPYLPLASGAYSMTTGRIIVFSCLVLALITSFREPYYLFATVGLSILIGTAYSVEPIRLKKYHFWAAFCIIVVRGLLVNLLLYAHFRVSMGEELQYPWSVWLLTAVVFVFGLIIAWFKDLPDTEGDAAYGIRTLSLVRNRDWVYSRGSAILLVTLLAATGVAAVYGNWWLALGQVGAIVCFTIARRTLDLEDTATIARFYQLLWVTFFWEYAAFGLFG